MNFTRRDWSSHPPYVYPDYKSTSLRGPTRPLVPADVPLHLPPPVYGATELGPLDHDLTRNARVNGEPLGERIIVTGRILDEAGHPVPHTLVEIWQANAGGRYMDRVDQHDVPLDPNFLGAGRCLTDGAGRYRFLTVKPGSYPWRNHPNAWRPNHIHFSVFGTALNSRLVTQMYFPGDPLFAYDPIFQSVPPHARERVIAQFSLAVTEPEYALGYEFDIVLRGPAATPGE